MKFTKTWKRFWTLNRHHAAGFTLVELIVVIAILAILAGIAIPAYSGYINKAKEAGDYTLLSAINTAFAAACLEEGNSFGPGEVTIDGYQNGNDAEITVSENSEAFAAYMAGNLATNFEVIDNLWYDGTAFISESMEPHDYNGTTVYIPSSVKNALQGSSFVNLGGAGLANSVGDLTGMVTGDYEDFDTMAQSLFGEENGVETAVNMILKYTGDESVLAQGEDESDEAYQDRMQDMLANSIVLDVANTTTTMDKESLTNYLNGGNLTSGNEGLAQAALAYGMYTAYLNSGKAPEGSTLDITSMQAALGDKDSGFNAWLKDDPQAQEDMDAYLGALDVISDNTNNTDLTAGVVVNGFNSADNAELAELLTELLGK